MPRKDWAKATMKTSRECAKHAAFSRSLEFMRESSEVQIFRETKSPSLLSEASTAPFGGHPIASFCIHCNINPFTGIGNNLFGSQYKESSCHMLISLRGLLTPWSKHPWFLKLLFIITVKTSPYKNVSSPSVSTPEPGTLEAELLCPPCTIKVSHREEQLP